MTIKRTLVFVPLAVLTAFIAFGSLEVNGVLHQSPAGQSSVRPAPVPAGGLNLLPYDAPVAPAPAATRLDQGTP
jgi:hypothetical protein